MPVLTVCLCSSSRADSVPHLLCPRSVPELWKTFGFCHSQGCEAMQMFCSLLSALLDTKWLLLKTFLNVKVWGSSLVCTPSLLHPASNPFALFQNFHVFSFECSANLAVFYFLLSVFFFFLPFLCSEPKLCNLFRPLSAVAVAFIGGSTTYWRQQEHLCQVATRGRTRDAWRLLEFGGCEPYVAQTSVFTKVEMWGRNVDARYFLAEIMKYFFKKCGTKLVFCFS